MKGFRVLLQVGDLGEAKAFYSKLFGIEGREVGGNRVYFDTEGGFFIFAVVQTADPVPNAESFYLTVVDLKLFHARAFEMGCLSKVNVHGGSAADIVRRPWGEVSFYCIDPWENKVCFVQEDSRFTGQRKAN
jgi:predicted enzyme related to lactoylglutathione lyase